MSNAEKLAKEIVKNLDVFAKILFNGICTVYKCCDDCPLLNVHPCCDEKAIKEYLESGIEEDVEEIVHCKDCIHRDPEDKKCDGGFVQKTDYSP